MGIEPGLKVNGPFQADHDGQFQAWIGQRERRGAPKPLTRYGWVKDRPAKADTDVE